MRFAVQLGAVEPRREQSDARHAEAAGHAAAMGAAERVGL